MRRGADILLRCLRAEGVDLVFGYPGGAIMRRSTTRSKAAGAAHLDAT